MTELIRTSEARLCVQDFGGKEHVSVIYTPGQNRELDWCTRYQQLTPDQANLPLDELRALFFAGKLDLKPKAYDIELAKTIAKNKELLKRVERIIQESKFPAEVAEFKNYWTRLTGREWVGKEGVE